MGLRNLDVGIEVAVRSKVTFVFRGHLGTDAVSDTSEDP